MIVPILSEMEKGVDSSRQTNLKTVWSDINGEVIDNPALLRNSSLYAEQFCKNYKNL